MLPGQGMHQQMSLGPSQPCWSSLVPSCRRSICCSSCVPRDDAAAPDRACPALGDTAQPGWGRAGLGGPWGGSSLLGLSVLTRPHPAPRQWQGQTQSFGRFCPNQKMFIPTCSSESCWGGVTWGQQ